MPLQRSVFLGARAVTVAALVTGSVVLMATAAFAATTASSSSADQLVALMNKDRAAAGRRALTASAELAGIATSHSQQMADQATIFHTADLGQVVPSWLVLDENVATGGSVGQVEQGFMLSPVHRANVLDSRVTEAGVGVVATGSQLWVTVIFRLPTSAGAVRTPAQTTSPTTAKPAAAPRPAVVRRPVAPPTTAPAPAPVAPAPTATTAVTAPPATTPPTTTPPTVVSVPPNVPEVHPARLSASKSSTRRAGLGGHRAMFAVGLLVWLAVVAIVRRGTRGLRSMRRRNSSMRKHPSFNPAFATR